MDEEKERRNVAKHKIPFAEAVTVFDDPLFVIAADDDHSGRETVYYLGRVSARKISYAERGKATRIVNARKATARERKNYEEEI